MNFSPDFFPPQERKFILRKKDEKKPLEDGLSINSAKEADDESEISDRKKEKEREELKTLYAVRGGKIVPAGKNARKEFLLNSSSGYSSVDTRSGRRRKK